MSNFSSLVLASDRGELMKSSTHKVLHKICGYDMLRYVIDAQINAGAKTTVVFAGDYMEEISKAVPDVRTIGFADSLNRLKEDIDNVLIVSGSVPLITGTVITEILKKHINNKNDITYVSDPFDESFATICFVKREIFANIKERLISNNSDRVNIENLKNENLRAEFVTLNTSTLIAVKDRIHLSQAEKAMQKRINESFMRNGVTIIDPDNTYICANAKIGTDTIIYPGTVIEGNTEIGENVYIGLCCKLTDAKIADGVDINISTIVKSSIGAGTHVGPYAYIRPDCIVGKECKIGDFVELKKAVIGDGTKLSHLTYVGDAEVGRHVNFGCGTVTVNYDGKSKYKTVIKDNAFIGCNTNLVSPVTVEEGAYIAAGSTITDDIPKNNLAIARARQINKDTWQDKRKK